MKTRNASRVSKGLPRKRPSYELDDLRPSRPKRQKRPPPKKKFPFMKLPAEIRLKILRELLWHPEPLKFVREEEDRPSLSPPWPLAGIHRCRGDLPEKTNYAFHPAVLAVCRKLNDEGIPVLYEENTVEVAVYQARGYSYGPRCGWMGHATSLDDISEILSARARKLQIKVQVRSRYTTPESMRAILRRLVDDLQQNPQWCSLDIRLDDHLPKHQLFDQFSEDEEEIHLNDEEALRPFKLLRRLRHVSFRGASPALVAKLTRLMKSDVPVVDLPKMYDNLENYAYANADEEVPGTFLEEYLYRAQDAMDDGNEADFYIHRNQVMWEIEKILRKEQADVFKDDPNPISSRLSSHEFAHDQEYLEGQRNRRDLIADLQRTIAESQEKIRLKKEVLQRPRETPIESCRMKETSEGDSTVEALEEHVATCERTLEDLRGRPVGAEDD